MGRVCNEGFSFVCVCMCGSTDIKKKTTTLLHRTKGSSCLRLKYQMKVPTSGELCCFSLLQYFANLSICLMPSIVYQFWMARQWSPGETFIPAEKSRCHCCTSHLGAQRTAFISTDKVSLIRSGVILTSQERIYIFGSWHPWQASST